MILPIFGIMGISQYEVRRYASTGVETNLTLYFIWFIVALFMIVGLLFERKAKIMLGNENIVSLRKHSPSTRKSLNIIALLIIASYILMKLLSMRVPPLVLLVGFTIYCVANFNNAICGDSAFVFMNLYIPYSEIKLYEKCLVRKDTRIKIVTESRTMTLDCGSVDKRDKLYGIIEQKA